MTKTKAQKARAKARQRANNNSNNNNRGSNRQPARRSSIVMANLRNGPAVVPAPSISRERSSRFDLLPGPKNLRNSILCRGMDLIASVTPAGTVHAAGEVVYSALVDGRDMFQGTRLARFFDLYEKYCFKRIRFHWAPCVSSSTQGGIMLAYDKDASDPTPSADFHGLQQYAAMEGARQASVWSELSVDCLLSDTQNFYYTNEAIPGTNDERLYAQGQLYAVLTNAVTYPANLPLGNIWCEWECLLMDPQLADPDVEISVDKSVPGDTAVPTTNYSAWNALAGAVPDKVGNGATWTNSFDGTNYGFLVPQGTYQVTWAVPTTVTNAATEGQWSIGVFDAKTKALIDTRAPEFSSGIEPAAISTYLSTIIVYVTNVAGAYLLATNTAVMKRGDRKSVV